jgi:histone acetyltransferase (RNA polymerase elongator complex component)
VITGAVGSRPDTVEVGLFGGNIFGVEPGALRKLFSQFDAHEQRISNFRISTKPVPLRRETIDILKAHRVTVIELGIPTFNNGILALLNRRHTASDLVDACHLLVDEGFEVALQVMVGLPHETFHDVQVAAEEIVRLKPRYLRIYPLVVLAGTPLQTMYEQRAYTPASFEEVVKRALFLYLRAMKHGIKTVKMGLTENEVLARKIIGGYHHPAFGYVVKASAFYWAILAKSRLLRPGGVTTVLLNGRDIPHLTGYRRSNIEKLAAHGFPIRWEKEEVPEGRFRLLRGGDSAEGSVLDALSGIELASTVA